MAQPVPQLTTPNSRWRLVLDRQSSATNGPPLSPCKRKSHGSWLTDNNSTFADVRRTSTGDSGLADLAGVYDPFLVASAEHAGGDLAVVVVGSVAHGVADDGDVCFLENVCKVTWRERRTNSITVL